MFACGAQAGGRKACAAMVKFHYRRSGWQKKDNT